MFFYFAEAEARIDSPSNKEVHVKQRSKVKLTCVVDLGSGSGADSTAVFWYLDGQALDWLGQTGPGRGVRVTERRGRQLISTLVIERADMHHAGKFTCAPSYAKPDTVTLHVIDGKIRRFYKIFLEHLKTLYSAQIYISRHSTLFWDCIVIEKGLSAICLRG